MIVVHKNNDGNQDYYAHTCNRVVFEVQMRIRP